MAQACGPATCTRKWQKTTKFWQICTMKCKWFITIISFATGSRDGSRKLGSQGLRSTTIAAGSPWGMSCRAETPRLCGTNRITTITTPTTNTVSTPQRSASRRCTTSKGYREKKHFLKISNLFNISKACVRARFILILRLGETKNSPILKK